MSEEKKAPKEPKAAAKGAEGDKPEYGNKRKKVAWTLKRCQKLARRYSSEKEWQHGSPSSYKAAIAHGWVKECASLFTRGTTKKLPKSA